MREFLQFEAALPDRLRGLHVFCGGIGWGESDIDEYTVPDKTYIRAVIAAWRDYDVAVPYFVGLLLEVSSSIDHHLHLFSPRAASTQRVTRTIPIFQASLTRSDHVRSC